MQDPYAYLHYKKGHMRSRSSDAGKYGGAAGALGAVEDYGLVW